MVHSTGPRMPQKTVPRSVAAIGRPLDRGSHATLADQLRERIARAILDGALEPGARLPSWRDLASQLGVARGTVKQAYDELVDAHLVTASGARGTRVSPYPLRRRARARAGTLTSTGFPYYAVEPLPFQPGVPSRSGFPTQ